MQIVPPPSFCHVSKFHAPDYLHYNAVMQQKAYQAHYSNRVFTISQKYIFKVHQITKSPLHAENWTFFWQGHGQNVPLRMYQDTPFKVKNSIIFLWRGHSPSPDTFPGGKGYNPSPHPPLTSLLDPPCVPPEFLPDLRHWWPQHNRRPQLLRLVGYIAPKIHSCLERGLLPSPQELRPRSWLLWS